MSDAPIINIVGELVTLGPLQRDLLPIYQRWMNDFAVIRTLGGTAAPMTLEREEAWFERVAKGDDSFSFTIYEQASGTPIGNTSLMGIDWRSRTAEFGILIGEADGRGKGYGTETARLMLDYAFTALGFHSLCLRVDEFNLAGRRAYAKAGFREFGRRRQSQLMGGKFWDTIYMDCLASEFTSPVLAAVFAPDQPR